ncbi:hypothetical protein [Paenibacillus sp. sgz500958]|uniref:hypothetical protein n=1 Tax=Paenibacillus sp. sgz500958 TaxID=3242475 RepID=UPI0036D42B11
MESIMKKFFIFLFVVNLLSACSPSKETQASELKIQADQHYNNGDLKSAEAVYEKSLQLVEDPQVRQKLTTTKSEITALAAVRSSIDELRTAMLEMERSADLNEGLATAKKIEKIATDLPYISAPKDTKLEKYLKELKRDKYLFLVKANAGMFFR